MMTDTDTTPYRETVNGKTYYFCSDGCKAKFDKAPASYVTLNARLAGGAGPHLPAGPDDRAAASRPRSARSALVCHP